MRTIRDHGLVLVTALVVGSSCAPFHLDIRACPSERLPNVPDKVIVQYLGVGGFLIRRGEPAHGQVFLTGPLYSNPSLLEIAADHAVRPDAELIDRLLPSDAAFARAILVGHAHYDHLMDVPYVALRRAKGATVYGSETTGHLLAPIASTLAGQGGSVYAFAPHEIWDGSHDGVWKEIASHGPQRVLVAAIRSEHSPQTALKVGDQRIPFHLWRGKVFEDAHELPRTASDWAEGTVLAYVVDFMTGAKVDFRVYYQDSGTNDPIGMIPENLKRGRDVDLTIICLGGDNERLIAHPEAIIRNTRPRFILLAHWEDFFVTQDAYCSDGGHYGPVDAPAPGCKDGNGRIYGVPKSGFTEGNRVQPFVARVQREIKAAHLGTKYWLPCPTRSVFEFEVR